MTPFKSGGASGAGAADTSCFSVDDSDAAMEESSVLSSPPRSGPRSSRISLFFEDDDVQGAPIRRTSAESPRNRRLFADEDDEDDDADNDDDPVQLPRRRGAKTPVPPLRRAGARPSHRPTLRTLDLNNKSSSSSHGLEDNDTRRQSSEGEAPIARPPARRRHYHHHNRDGPTFGMSRSMDEADEAMSTHSRKRSSAERRSGGGGAASDDEMIGTASGSHHHHNGHQSPRISPNSFLTMDGRFVQSKNPFSSPMMMEEMNESQNAAMVAMAAAAPPLPDSFLRSTEAKLGLTPAPSATSGSSPQAGGTSQDPPFGSNNSSNTLPGFLPRVGGPASAAALKVTASSPRPPSSLGFAANGAPPPALTPFASTAAPTVASSDLFGSILNGGFPDKRYSFTGSPIREEHESHQLARAASSSSYATTPPSPHQHLDTSADAMETDTASCGSLHKVRRINLADDVVSATGHALRLRRPQLRVDTTAMATYGSGRLSDGGASVCSSISSHSGFYPSLQAPSGDDDAAVAHQQQQQPPPPPPHEDISPTDVMSFPPPPTPAKAKSTPVHYGYSHNNNNHQNFYGYNNNHQNNNNQYQYSAARPSTRRPTPPTPVAERRRLAAQAARTAHPGSLLHQHNGGTGNGGADGLGGMGAGASTPKSRFYGDFDVISELGKGCFGTVYKVLSRLDGCMYAIKAAKRQAKGPTDRDRMLKEVYALAALSDQADTATFHIVRYHQAWMEEDRLYIQTELCQGSLADEMANGLLPMTRRYKLLREICLALEILHRHNMVHLDIKPENIFVKNDQFKLGDFGLVTKISSHQDIEEGDSRYMSLELLSGDHSDLTKSDIFSLGATMYEICRGQPLPHNGTEWQEIRSGRLTPWDTTTSHSGSLGDDGNSHADLATLVQQMMQPDFSLRPAATELLKRPQLLSDEQKALMVERTKVAQANLALQKIHQLQSPPPLPMRRGLQRANTWGGLTTNGATNPYV